MCEATAVCESRLTFSKDLVCWGLTDGNRARRGRHGAVWLWRGFGRVLQFPALALRCVRGYGSAVRELAFLLRPAASEPGVWSVVAGGMERFLGLD
jgi:hypothetical protein